MDWSLGLMRMLGSSLSLPAQLTWPSSKDVRGYPSVPAPVAFPWKRDEPGEVHSKLVGSRELRPLSYGPFLGWVRVGPQKNKA